MNSSWSFYNLYITEIKVCCRILFDIGAGNDIEYTSIFKIRRFFKFKFKYYYVRSCSFNVQ